MICKHGIIILLKLLLLHSLISIIFTASNVWQCKNEARQTRGENWFCLQFLLCFAQYQIESNPFEADSISRSLCSTFLLMDKFKLSRKSKNKFKAFCQMPILLDFDKTAIEL